MKTTEDILWMIGDYMLEEKDNVLTPWILTVAQIMDEISFDMIDNHEYTP